jgi:hypothetical protein
VIRPIIAARTSARSQSCATGACKSRRAEATTRPDASAAEPPWQTTDGWVLGCVCAWQQHSPRSRGSSELNRHILTWRAAIAGGFGRASARRRAVAREAEVLLVTCIAGAERRCTINSARAEEASQPHESMSLAFQWTQNAVQRSQTVQVYRSSRAPRTLSVAFELGRSCAVRPTDQPLTRPGAITSQQRGATRRAVRGASAPAQATAPGRVQRQSCTAHRRFF